MLFFSKYAETRSFKTVWNEGLTAGNFGTIRKLKIK
jgi:hypothetical protein